jgi:hypothetical protein
MVAMWAARNDIGYTAERVGQANTKDAPEFFYLVRLLLLQENETRRPRTF